MIRIAKTNGVVRLPKAKNVLGGKLEICCTSPMTGFFRDGCCNTGPEDVGSHTVCVVMTAEFLAFSKSAGNDLSTPNLQWGFPGLQPGDRWCLCAPRWQEALDAGHAPKVVLAATHEAALAFCDLEDLKAHAVDRLTLHSPAISAWVELYSPAILSRASAIRLMHALPRHGAVVDGDHEHFACRPGRPRVTMPSLMPNFILRGARLATQTTSGRRGLPACTLL